jgi:GH15 family glucan-1,4-alpha-glucosidase
MDNYNYGVIGNCNSAALVSDTGSIDWFCIPDFDSASIFARLLDERRGGHFAVEGVGDYRIEQQYLRRTNILVTRFRAGEDAFDLIDFMPRHKNESGSYHNPPDVIRYLRLVSGRPKIRVDYQPRLGYARYDTHTEIDPEFIKSYTLGGPYESAYLYSDLDHRNILDGEPIELDRDHFLLLSYNQKIVRPDLDHIQLEMERTKVYWMGWCAKATSFPQWEDAIERSSLVLKMLAYQKTGAILAAVTTSLPESIGEVRNWDYRYCWIRDASMTIAVLTGLGHYNVAKRFLKFVLSIVPYKDEKIQIMYGIRGQKRLKERTLPWLAGYRGSQPVRIGNEAFLQKQNDIYGVLMDVIYQNLLIFRNTMENLEELWTVVRTLTRHVKNNWSKPDRGIWEIRSEKKHFTFSKTLCWVALDRGVKIAQLLGKQADADDWAVARDRIKADILENGFNERIGAFTQSYNDENLDAANLLMEHYGFLPPDDEKYVSTVWLTYKRLCVDGLMYRYRNADDFGVPHSSFTVCTFWMIKSLHRIGEKKLAREMFQKVLGCANHLGLFSEDIDFSSKRLLGNFPQGYSHLALIDTAMELMGHAAEIDQPHHHVVHA